AGRAKTFLATPNSTRKAWNRLICSIILEVFPHGRETCLNLFARSVRAYEYLNIHIQRHRRTFVFLAVRRAWGGPPAGGGSLRGGWRSGTVYSFSRIRLLPFSTAGCDTGGPGFGTRYHKIRSSLISCRSCAKPLIQEPVNNTLPVSTSRTSNSDQPFRVACICHIAHSLCVGVIDPPEICQGGSPALVIKETDPLQLDNILSSSNRLNAKGSGKHAFVDLGAR